MMTATSLPQGDVRLLRSDVARRLLASTELARLAYMEGVLDFVHRLPGTLAKIY